MGIAPSKTELLLPSDTIRICSPDRCWCNGRHHNRSSKYVYVERGGDGRERYQDPVDMMGEFLMSGGGNMGMPWKNPGEWTVRDYERLGEVLNEWQARERGRRRNPSTGNPAMMGGGNMYGPSPWEGGGGGGGHGRRRRAHPSWGEFERMQETVEDKFRRMAQEYQRHISERDSLLFGSASDHRREQYRNNMLKTLQEILPQLSQMMAAQQMSGGGMNMGMGMGMGMQNGMPSGGIPGTGAGMGAGPGPPGMGLHGGAGMQGMQGMNMNHPMMNSNGGGMGYMNPAMMPNDFGGGGGGGGLGRRGRGRRERPFREDFDEDFGGFGGSGGGGGGGGGRAGRTFRRGRRGGWGDDEEEDMLGGDDFSPPRQPQGGPQIPRRPDGGGDFDADGGLGLDRPTYGHQDDDPFRTTPPIPPRHAHFHSQPNLTRQPGMGFPDPERSAHPIASPLQRTSLAPGQAGYSKAWDSTREKAQDEDIRPSSISGARQWYTGGGSLRPAYDAPGPTTFASGTVGETAPSALRTDPARREAGVRLEARLARPRDEEIDRRQPEAGDVPTKRDTQ